MQWKSGVMQGLRSIVVPAGVACAVVLASTAAEAHPHGAGDSLTAGFAHPLRGLDHLLVMVAIGVWAARQGGKALLAVPAAFVVAMAAGGLAGYLGLGLPMVEFGIMASVVLLVAAVVLNLRPALPVTLAFVGLFGLLHGHAHGTELPASASAVAYGAGFVGVTAALHGLGIVATRAVAWLGRAVKGAKAT